MKDPTLRDLISAPLGEWFDEQRWGDVEMRLRALSRFALRGLPLAAEDVDDLVQEVVLRFIENSRLRQTATEIRSLNLYLAKTLRNAALDLLRRRERQQRLRGAPQPTVAPDDIERLHDELDLQRIVGVLGNLPAEDQRLIRLRFWEELTLEQLAERYNISISTAAYRLMRILATIRRELGR